MAAAAAEANRIKDLLLSPDTAGQVELLLTLLSDAAAGKELSNAVSEVIQVAIAGGVGHQQVKKLAYDLCKSVPLLPSDYSLLVDGLKNDISCGVPEGQVLALRFLPCLPPDYLLELLEKGEIANCVAPHTRNVVPMVRCAATSALCAVLLVPEVQAALAASPDLSASGSDWWDAVVDSVGDSMPDVLVAGLAATNALFEAASSGGSGGAPVSAVACLAPAHRAALRLAAGVGPLMDTWRMLPSHAQVPVVQLLGHVWRTLLDMDAAAAAAAAQPGGAKSLLPASSGASLAAALPGMLGYLSTSLSSLNPAVKLEAARVVLRLSRLGRRNQQRAPLGRLALIGEIPPATAAAAIEALLELKGRLLVEAALEDVVSLVAANLDVLQVPTRLAVLSRLWPMIALLQSPTDRLTAFVHAWRAALALALDSAAAAAQGVEAPGGAAATLSGILSDPFLEDVISETATGRAGLVGAGAAAGTDGGAAANGTGGGAEPGSAADALGIVDDDSLLAAAGQRRKAAGMLQSAKQSAKGLVSSSAALAGSVGGALAAAASGALSQLPRFLWETPPPQKAQLPATLKQELVCSLLEVLSQHPAAAAALQLPPGKPVPPPAPAALDAAAAKPAGGGEAAKPQPQPSPFAAFSGAASPAPDGAAAPNAGTIPAPASPAARSSSDGAADVAPAAAAAAPAPPQLRPQFGPDDVSTSPIVASLQSQVVLWLGAAVAALRATRPCLHWEPLVPPPMPGQPPTPPLPPLASVNLTTVPVDAWLQLLQAACHAVRGAVRLHGYDSLKAIYRANGGRMLPQLSPWDASGVLAKTCEAAAAELQQLLTRELAEWRGLALAVRPRVLWVAAHYLELPALLDDTWGLLLACVEDDLSRAGGKQEVDGRTRQLAASAKDGLLLKRFALPQLSNLGPDKSGAHTTFDAAAASALVEMHEYASDGLQVGLTVLQYLVWLVAASLAASPAGPGAPPGPAEEALARKLLQLVKTAGSNEAAGVDARDWCKRMARGLNALLDPAGTGAAGAGGASAAAAGGPAFAMAAPPPGGRGGASKAALPSGYNAVAGFSALGYGGGSSSSDDDDAGVLTREQRLQRKLGLGGPKHTRHAGRRGASSSGSSSGASGGSASGSDSSSSDSDSSGSDASSDHAAGAAPQPAPAAAGGSSDEEDGGGAGPNPFSAGAPAAVAAAAAAAAGTGDGHRDGHRAAARAARRAAKAAKRAAKKRAEAEALAVGAPDSASGVWGFPFGGPRSQTLFISRRSRRHRLFKWQLALAMAHLADADAADGGSGGGGGGGPQPGGGAARGGGAGGFGAGTFGAGAGDATAGAGLTDATGPVFSAASGFRLDQPGFWDSLRGGESGWVELSGPADPLVLSGRYSTGGGSGSGSSSADITVVLRAFNRLAVDLEGVEVAVRLVGPVRAERREASWMLPRLLPTEAAQHAFVLTPTGYGRLEVHARLLLPLPQLASELATSGPPGLACQPLVVSMARLLRPPACPPPNAQEVLALWASLPVQMELSATAMWPGLDGLLLLLSALARQPLHCAWCHMLPVVCGAQAAFVACPSNHTADSLVIMLLAQLMPDQAEADAEAAAAAATAAAAEAAAKAAAAAAGNAADDAASDAGSASGADAASQQSEQEQQQAAAAAGRPMPMRCVVQVVVRSSSHEVLLTIQQQPDVWLEDISQGTLSCGVSAGGIGLRPSHGKPLLHPLVARLEQQLASAALLGPPPPAVPPLELPPPPSFRRKLANKADEEDSDAEDEELPLTSDEAALQQVAREKHRHECDKAREAHEAAKASRASAVLRQAALAEWRRTACPPLLLG